MSSFLEIVEEKRVLFGLRDYGVDNLLTWRVIEEVLENSDIFSNFYAQFPLSTITNVEEYCLYLFSLRLSKLRGVISRIDGDKDREFVRELVNDADKIIEGIEKRDVISFINAHIRDIFNREHEIYDLPLVTLDLIATYRSGIDKAVFDFLCKKYSNLIIEQFDIFESVFKKYPDLFPYLFRIEKPEDLHVVHLDTVLGIWAHVLNKKESVLKRYVDRGIDIFSENFEKLAENATPEEALFIEKDVNDFLSFLRRIESPKANTFVECVNQVAKLSQEYVTEHGHSSMFEIPVKEMIDKKLNTNHWGVRLLAHTHKTQTEGEEVNWISYLEKGPKKNELVDLFGTATPTNDFFTMSYQTNLFWISQTLTAFILGTIFDQEARDDYLILMKHAFHFMSEQMGNSVEDMEQDFELLAQMIYLVVQNADSDDSVTRSLCYGASMYCVALLEKVLKNFYVYLVKDEKYVSLSKITLGQLLSVEKNPEITSVFGENHVKNLVFFLLRIPNTDIGENMRNSLAHLHGVSPENFTPQLVAKALWLFTDVLNTILWYFVERVLKNNLEDN